MTGGEVVLAHHALITAIPFVVPAFIVVGLVVLIVVCGTGARSGPREPARTGHRGPDWTSLCGMDALAGPYLAAAALLVAAGAGQAARPGPLVRALRSVGVRPSAPAVRTGAALRSSWASLRSSPARR